MPQGSTQNTLVARYNDLANVEELIKGGDIAAVILEPVVGNSGFIQPTKEFLQGCRDLSTKYGTLLVFDEVMTGFRVAYGGAQVCRLSACLQRGFRRKACRKYTTIAPSPTRSSRKIAQSTSKYVASTSK